MLLPNGGASSSRALRSHLSRNASGAWSEQDAVTQSGSFAGAIALGRLASCGLRKDGALSPRGATELVEFVAPLLDFTERRHHVVPTRRRQGGEQRHSSPGPPVPAAHRATFVLRPPSCAERKSTLQRYHRSPKRRLRQLWGSAPARPFGLAPFNIRHVAHGLMRRGARGTGPGGEPTKISRASLVKVFTWIG
jgi:hypothetical protein